MLHWFCHVSAVLSLLRVSFAGPSCNDILPIEAVEGLALRDCMALQSKCRATANRHALHCPAFNSPIRYYPFLSISQLPGAWLRCKHGWLPLVLDGRHGFEDSKGYQVVENIHFEYNVYSLLFFYQSINSNPFPVPGPVSGWT